MKLPVWKLILFAAVTVGVVFALVEGILFLVGIRPVLYDEDPYVGFTSQSPLFVEETGLDGTVEMVTAANKEQFFQVQRFPREKPGKTIRIFCMGGSTTFGRPYDDKTSFAGWLRAYLPEADDSHPWEVINAGGVSYASYRIALLMEELVRYEPDLFVIYTGHNEFLERRTYEGVIEMPKALRGIGALASRTRLYTVVRDTVEAVRKSPNRRLEEGEDALPGEVETILENSVGPSAYKRDDDFKAQVVEHFRYNLHRMVDIAHSVGARVVFVKPGSNLRNSSPFKSEHRFGLTEEELKEWKKFNDGVDRALKASDWDEAIGYADRSLAIDDRHAHLHYKRAEALWESGRFEEAKEAYIRARDEDICPLRILTPMESVVSGVAGERKTGMVDFKSFLEDKSEQGIPGESFFLDHVHPTIEGNRQLAFMILSRMADDGLVQYGAGWNEDKRIEVKERVENSLDRGMHGRALRNLARLMRWAGKHEDGYRTAFRAVEQIPDDVEANFMAGSNAYHLGYYEASVRFLRRVLELAPDHDDAAISLGDALLAKGDFAGAESAYNRAMSINPDQVVARNNLGNLYLNTGRLEEATLLYNEVLLIQPDYAEAHHNLGLALSNKGKFDEAIDCFERAIEIKPDYSEAYSNLGSAYALKGNMEEAMNWFRQALKINDQLAEAHLNLGLILTGMEERTSEAKTHLQEAIEIDPGGHLAHLELAQLFLLEGKQEEAIVLFEKVEKLRPDMVEVPLTLGEIRIAEKDFKGALHQFLKAIKSRPDLPEGYFGAGLAYEGIGLPEEAIKKIEKALQIQPEWARATVVLARIFAFYPDLLIKDLNKAVSLVEPLVEQGRDLDLNGWLFVADIFVSARRIDKAITASEKALAQAEISGATELAERIRERIEEYRKATK